MTKLISSNEAIIKIAKWEPFTTNPNEYYTSFVSVKKDWQEFELFFK